VVAVNDGVRERDVKEVDERWVMAMAMAMEVAWIVELGRVVE
jgi:hypothetical protein